MRRYFLLVVCLCLASLLRAQNKLELISPNGELKVSLNLSDKIYYSIDYNGDVLLKDNTLQLTLRNQVLGRKSQTAPSETYECRRAINSYCSFEICESQ